MLVFLVFYSLLGLIVGSFLNVCIYRIPRRQSIVFPGSHCPSCNAPIRPYDNVPLLAYCWLGGRCRNCKSRISLQYPAVELLAALSFLGCALRWGMSPPTFLNSIFLAIVIVLVFVDYQHRILPNVLTIPGTVAGILLCVFQDRQLFLDGPVFGISSMIGGSTGTDTLIPWVGSIFGALVGSGILFFVAFAYRAVRKRQGLGMGDIKMMAFVGAFIGWRLALLTIFAGSFLGSLLGIFLILFQGKNLQSKMAFGTFLGAGATLSLFFGFALFAWYSGTL